MILDLVEITPKKLNIKKVIICSIIIILVIGIIVFFIFNKEMLKKEKISEKEQTMVSKNIPIAHKIEYKTKLKQTRDIREQINNIYKSEEKRVFLTFDDGPSKTVTPLILDLLKQENIKATFFLLGSRVELNPDLVKREYNEGHYLANHGYSHIYSNIYQSSQTVLDEFNATEQAIKNAIQNQDYNSHLFRCPGGTSGGKYAEIKREAKEMLEQNGIAHLDWNALTADAAGKNTVEGMITYVEETIGDKNSVVILMHDASDKILTYEMLPQLISYLREQGYSFKNIYDLIEE